MQESFQWWGDIWNYLPMKLHCSRQVHSLLCICKINQNCNARLWEHYHWHLNGIWKSEIWLAERKYRSESHRSQAGAIGEDNWNIWFWIAVSITNFFGFHSMSKIPSKSDWLGLSTNQYWFLILEPRFQMKTFLSRHYDFLWMIKFLEAFVNLSSDSRKLFCSLVEIKGLKKIF